MIAPIETKPCPKCGKQMIKWDQMTVYATNPPQYPWDWRCGCGHQEKGGVRRGKTMEDLFVERWTDANIGPTSTYDVNLPLPTHCHGPTELILTPRRDEDAPAETEE